MRVDGAYRHEGSRLVVGWSVPATKVLQRCRRCRCRQLGFIVNFHSGIYGRQITHVSGLCRVARDSRDLSGCFGSRVAAGKGENHG